MTVTQEPQYTILEVRCAITVAKLGRGVDVPEPLRELAEEIARDADCVYRISGADIAAYLEDCGEDLTDQQRAAFRTQAQKYIDNSNSGAFGESLQVCLDVALGDVLGGIAEALTVTQ